VIFQKEHIEKKGGGGGGVRKTPHRPSILLEQSGIKDIGKRGKKSLESRSKEKEDRWCQGRGKLSPGILDAKLERKEEKK